MTERTPVRRALLSVWDKDGLVALARYGDQLSWARPAAWAFLAFVISVLIAGVYGSWKVTAGSTQD